MVLFRFVSHIELLIIVIIQLQLQQHIKTDELCIS
jgi:hypothetical protein